MLQIEGILIRIHLAARNGIKVSDVFTDDFSGHLRWVVSGFVATFHPSALPLSVYQKCLPKAHRLATPHSWEHLKQKARGGETMKHSLCAPHSLPGGKIFLRGPIRLLLRSH